MDFKKRIEAAMIKNHQRQYNQGVTREQRPKRKKPEKNTEKEVLLWGKENNVLLHVIEASTWNGRSHSFGDAKAEAGFSDLVGNTEQGLACYIELKAEGRRSTLSDKQRVFLEAKIAQMCFAVVVDSRKRLEQYWKGFWTLKTPDERCEYLLDCLPGAYNTKKRREAQLKEDEFGF